MKMTYLILGVLSCFSLQATAVSPTNWYLVNLTKSTVSINCKGKAKGLSQPLMLATVKISAQSNLVKVWSLFDNDGLGLNRASWTCLVDGESTHFESDWGQNLYLLLDKGGVRVFNDIQNSEIQF
jgi:hypothetical protein